MGTARIKRGRSRHGGVVLIAPTDGRAAWRARFLDPDTGKVTKERLDPTKYSNERLRIDWAIKKSKALADRREAIARGAVRATGSGLGDVIARYYDDHPKLRPATVTAYRGGTDKLQAWCACNGVDKADKLNRDGLMRFRAALASTPKHAAARGKGNQGKKIAQAVARSPMSVNRELRATRTVLGYLVDADQFARLTHDDLRRALKREKVDNETLGYLKPGELRALIEGAHRHDALRFTIARDEHKGLRPIGTTPRFPAIAPFVCVTLLTGMRLGEALGIDWGPCSGKGCGSVGHVNLDALDLAGRKVGEIHLHAAKNKTHRARTIDLAVSPALRRLLAAMHLRDGGTGPVFRRFPRDAEGNPIALTRGDVDAGMKRLVGKVTAKGRAADATVIKGFGAPMAATWQALRRTAGTFLTNAPGIFGAASASRSAMQLGHSVTVAERSYVNLARGIPHEARDVETAMQVTDEVEAVIKAVTGTAQRDNVIAIGGKR